MGHSQSKTFWSFLILVDVLLLVAFGWALADRLYTVLEEPVVSMQPSRLPKAKEKKVPVVSETPSGPPSPATPTIVAEEPKPEPKPEPVLSKVEAPVVAKKPEPKKEPALSKAESSGVVKAKKVVFSYKNKSAKRVSIEGTFTKWDPKAMTKDKSGEWKYTTYLLPGYEYPYRLLVDGKIITDPTNPREKWGKSLMPVK